MQDWIIEADIYRIEKTLATEPPLDECNQLITLLRSKRRRLAELRGDQVTSFLIKDGPTRSWPRESI